MLSLKKTTYDHLLFVTLNNAYLIGIIFKN